MLETLRGRCDDWIENGKRRSSIVTRLSERCEGRQREKTWECGGNRITDQPCVTCNHFSRCAWTSHRSREVGPSLEGASAGGAGGGSSKPWESHQGGP